jgi:hypothetical protein
MIGTGKNRIGITRFLLDGCDKITSGMNVRSTFCQRFVDGKTGGHFGIGDFNLPHGPRCRLPRIGGNGGNTVPRKAYEPVENLLIFGYLVLVKTLRGIEKQIRNMFMPDDIPDSGYRKGSGRLNKFNAAVSNRREQKFSVQHTRRILIRGIPQRPSYLQPGVPDGTSLPD